ncbi:MAG: hypothetical protein J0L86_14165 [Flavobacteriales bacterium]|nr:hypothetical protein [Flavobacteriales bacterium]
MFENILAEIIGAFIIGLFIGTYKRYINPLIKEHFTDRIKLKKNWKSEINFGSGNLHGIKLELNKIGNDITGKIEFTSGRHQGKSYPIRGNFHSNILTFVYSPSDPTSTSQGSGTFKRLNDGELFNGYFAYYSQDSDQIRTVECAFTPI